MIVSGLDIADLATVRSLDLSRYTGVITIEEPDTDDPFRADVLPQLILQFHDIDMTMLGYVEPEPEHVQEAISFARRIDGPMLVHCRAGVSRSTAIALAIVADKLGGGREREACEWLRRTQPQAQPNTLVVFHADAVLRRDNSLNSAVKQVFKT